MAADRHVRRTGDDYAEALAALLPTGIAWPRARESVLMRVVRGLAQIFGFVDGRAADLLERESDPRLTVELLSDWERNWGLPDECFPDATTIEERRNMLLLKMTLLGGQSRAFFKNVAKWIGHGDINIREYSPYTCGISRCGDTSDEDDGVNMRWELGPPEIRFYWTINKTEAGLIWLRAGSGIVGVDPHLRISTPLDLDCLFRRWKPSHTELVFDFTNIGSPEDRMAGTP